MPMNLDVNVSAAQAALPADLRPRAVIFDCDGLLLDTERLWTLSERAVVEGRGGRWTMEFKRRLLGRAVPEAAEVIAAEVGAPAAATAIEQALEAGFLDALAEHGCDARPGAPELARALHCAGVPLAVASNSRRHLVVEAVSSAGLDDVFEVIVSAGDDYGERPLEPKPAPDVYREACARLGVDPVTAIALEDSQTGIEAARSAGLRVIGVPSLPGQTLEAEVVVPSLAALTLVGAPRDPSRID
jgi:HAD superfamily hydrolase (TIGR01509 family)